MADLRALPSVDRLLGAAAHLLETYSRELVTYGIREALQEHRRGQRTGDPTEQALLTRAEAIAARVLSPAPGPAINATGVVLHTNLGRAPLAAQAIAAAASVASGACALEMNIEAGQRGSRDDAVAGHLTALTGAEAATVVNNNAAAVLLALNSLAQGREVVVSRGELVEIGGSFRIPDILEKSGARLREVGTTNRTHPRDYAEAIGPDTGLLLKVHPSNYAIDGFTADVGLSELVRIGRDAGVPVVEDLGSGALIDLAHYGLPPEPVVGERIRSGVDAVTFSGDKLLGGPQAGLIAGRGEVVERMQRNPLKRALRCGKMTLAALDATLRLYRSAPDLEAALPTLRFLSRPLDDIEAVARDAATMLSTALGANHQVDVEAAQSQVGSGAQPTATLESRAVVISHRERSPMDIAASFRAAEPPIIGRVHDERFWLDARCIDDPSDLVPQKTNRRLIDQR